MPARYANRKSRPQRGGRFGSFTFRPRRRQMKYISATHQRLHQNEPKKGMGETAMMGEAKDRVFEIPQDVDIGGFRRQGHRGRGQRRLPVEPGTGQAGPGKKVSNRFQSLL